MAWPHLTERLFSLQFCSSSQENGRSLAQGVLLALFNGVFPRETARLAVCAQVLVGRKGWILRVFHGRAGVCLAGSLGNF